MSEWFKGFIDSLERLIEKPPYLLFVFVGTVFLAISLITKYNFEKMSVFFLYSVAGTVWRYAEKDLTSPLKEKLSQKGKKYSNTDLRIRTIYHIGNFVLLIAFLCYWFLSKYEL